MLATATDLPFPRVNLSGVGDPIPSILAAPEFSNLTAILAASPSTSLLEPASLALLYSIIRNLRPDHAVEIGTYRGGTAKLMSMALHQNGRGHLHTVSPFDADYVRPVFSRWPDELRARMKFYDASSMGFFIQAAEQHLRLDLVLVDGNHDYEYAMFDIMSAARRLSRGGFIFVDNVSQAGPYRAVLTFIKAHPEWINCGIPNGVPQSQLAYDTHRPAIKGTDFFILRAPQHYFVKATPECFGEMGWDDAPLTGIRAFPLPQANPGTLHIQCVYRAFSEKRMVETVVEASTQIGENVDRVDLRFDHPLRADGKFYRYSAEPWLRWSGAQPLAMTETPALL